MHFRTLNSSLRAPQGPWDTKDPLLGVDEVTVASRNHHHSLRPIRNPLCIDGELTTPALAWTATNNNNNYHNINHQFAASAEAAGAEVAFRNYAAAALPGGMSFTAMSAAGVYANSHSESQQQLQQQQLLLAHHHAKKKRIAEDALRIENGIKPNKLQRSDRLVTDQDSKQHSKSPSTPPSILKGSSGGDDRKPRANDYSSCPLPTSEEESRPSKATPARVSLYASDHGPEESVAAVAAAAKNNSSSQEDSDDGSSPNHNSRHSGLSASLYRAAMAVLQDDNSNNNNNNNKKQPPSEGAAKKPHRVSFQVEETNLNNIIQGDPELQQQYLVSLQSRRNLALQAFRLRNYNGRNTSSSQMLFSPRKVTTSRTWSQPLTREEHKLRYERVMTEPVQNELYESQFVTDLGPGGVDIPLSLLKKPLRPYDVLCGRDQLAFQNVGNRRLRTFVHLYMERYIQADQTGRTELHKQIRDTIVRAGGRFLKLADDDNKTGEWTVIGKVEARNKVAQAMRDQEKILSRKGRELRKHARIMEQFKSGKKHARISEQFKIVEQEVKAAGKATSASNRNDDEEAADEQPQEKPGATGTTRGNLASKFLDEPSKKTDNKEISNKKDDEKTESEDDSSCDEDDDDGDEGSSSRSASELVAMDDMNERFVTGPPQVRTSSLDEKRKHNALVFTEMLAAKVRHELATEEKIRIRNQKDAKAANTRAKLTSEGMAYLRNRNAQFTQKDDSVVDKKEEDGAEQQEEEEEVRVVVPERRNSNSSSSSSSSNSTSSSSSSLAPPDKAAQRMAPPPVKATKADKKAAPAKSSTARNDSDSDNDDDSTHNQSPANHVSVSCQN